MYKSTSKKKTGHIISWVCGFLFAIFSVLYLYYMQADLLATAQHVLSGGKTVYSPVWGTVVLTAMLLLLQGLCHKLLDFPMRFYALGYFPSCLVLGLITSVVPAGEGGVKWAVNWWLVGVCAALYVLLVWVVKHFPDMKSGRTFAFSYLWPNFLLFFLSFAMTGSVACTDDVCHYRLQAERLIVEGRDEEALEVGRNSLHADRSLTAMRAFALSRMRTMGGRLFEYPQYYGSEGLIPALSDTIYVHQWTDSLYVHLGGKPGKGLDGADEFLEVLSRLPSATQAVGDYLLCALLLDKRLDDFVAALPRFYPVDGNLPLHYKEALVLYNRLHTSPALIYKDDAVGANMDDFASYEAQFSDPVERANQCRRMYGHTYWWYYYYQALP